MNWLLIIVMLIFVICMVVGGIRGVFKIGVSLISSILTVVVVSFMAPHIGKAIQKFTPLDEMIEEKCIEVFMPQMTDEILARTDFSGTPLAGYSADEIKEMGQEDWEYLGISQKEILDLIGEIPRDQQIRQVEESAIPKFLKESLLENNNSSIYERLGVTHFTEYVAAYISRMILNVVSFLLTFLFAIIIVKALTAAADLIGELPVIGTINHAGGAAIGALAALLIVWIIFLVLTVFYSTKFGEVCFEMIDSSRILSVLYDTNLLLSKLLSF